MKLKQIHADIDRLMPLLEELDGSAFLESWKEKLKELDGSQRILLASILVYLLSDKQTTFEVMK